MIDHLIFNAHKFYPDTQIISDYIDTSLVGKSITYSKYKVGWIAKAEFDLNIQEFDDSTIEWTEPSGVINIASTGEILGIAMGQSKTAYYQVWFIHNMNNSSTGDGIYAMFIKASDIMKQNMSGNGL